MTKAEEDQKTKTAPSKSRFSALLCDAILPMGIAPKGGGAEMVTDPAYVEPPLILIFFEGDKVSVGRWDWYYAEGGNGYEGGLAWIEPVSGERLDLNYDAPIGWLPIFSE